MSEAIKRCKQCGKIIVGDNKLGLCPMCADKDKKGAAGIAMVAAGGFLAIKKYGKPAIELIKNVSRIIKK